MFKPFICTALVLASGFALAQEGGADRQALRAEWQAKADARFAAADVDKNGSLDKVEAQALSERLTANFDRIDGNSDGKLDRTELVQARERGGHRRHSARGGMAYMRGLFVGMDDDGDEAISRAELGTKAPKWAENFDKIDANADGKMSQAELRAYREAAMKARRAARAE